MRQPSTLPTVKILELMGERARQEALAGAEGDVDGRRGLYTSERGGNPGRLDGL